MGSIKSYEEQVTERCNSYINSVLACSDCTKKQLEILARYNGYLRRQNVTIQTKRTNLSHAKLLLLTLDRDLEQLTEQDIDKYLDFIDKKYKPRTASDKRMFLIQFLKWYFNKKKEDIALISNIKVKRNHTIKLPEELLSPKEIKKMIRVAENARDKAVVALLYETAARAGEFLQLRIKHIEIHKDENILYGFVTLPKGKTVSRKLPLIYSLPHVKDWINQHPIADNPNAPLFLNQHRSKDNALSTTALTDILKKYAKRALIQKKVYPHLLRHSRLTELGKELTEQELKVYAGWVGDSSMVKVYVHLSGQDVCNKVLVNAGLKDKKESNKTEHELTPKCCPMCNKQNPAENKYCECGAVVDLREAQRHVLRQEEFIRTTMLDILNSLGFDIKKLARA